MNSDVIMRALSDVSRSAEVVSLTVSILLGVQLLQLADVVLFTMIPLTVWERIRTNPGDHVTYHPLGVSY